MFKKVIRKYLKKKISHNNRNIVYYYWYRFLAEVVKDKNTENVLCGISSWLCSRDNENLLIHLDDVFVIDDLVYLCVRRPGLWIGKSGTRINSLEEYLNINREGDKINDFKIKIIEDNNSNFCSILKYWRIYNDF